MASDMNNVASSSKIVNATSSPCRPLPVTSLSPTSPTSSDNSETRVKLRSSNRLPMTWGTLRDQARTPSSRQMEPSRPQTKKRRQEENRDEGAEVELEERRGGQGGRAVWRYAA